MTHPALVSWLSPCQRGRKELPSTLRYVALSQFEEDGGSWPDGAWSVEVYFKCPPSEYTDAGPVPAQINFLFEEAPQARLYPGAHFSLYEGLQKVADVEVIG